MMQKQAEDEADASANPNSSKARDLSNRKKDVVIVDDEPRKKSSGCCSWDNKK